MSLMLATAASLGVTNAYAPFRTLWDAKYISKMLDQYNEDVSLVLVAYSTGSNNADKYGGTPLFAKTQNYVAKITQYLEGGVTVSNTETLYAAESRLREAPTRTY